MVTGTGIARTGLGGATGYGEIALPRSDDAAVQQDWSAVFGAGLTYFGRSFQPTDIFVNTNGSLSFGAAVLPYPTANPLTPTPDMIAPFWADVDTRLRGEGVESGQIYVDIDPIADCVSITWDDVGVYRRNTDQVNRFQIQLYDRGGGDFDIVFRYEAITWTIGSSTPDVGARALLTTPRLLDPVWILPGAGQADLSRLDTTPGNTGIAGLWVYEMRGGTIGELKPATGVVLTGTPAADTLPGTTDSDLLSGLDGHDVLRGSAGNDTLLGGDGFDTLNGGDGDDFIFGGTTAADLRDVIYAGTGNDSVDAGHGNDQIFGEAGNDSIDGGFGSDEIYGQGGNDVLTGAALSDLMFGGDNNDFINGGFGYDRLNGGTGADQFFHLGIHDHGSDWIQDYSAGGGDVLAFGISGATRALFQVNMAETANAGRVGIQEAFVIYKPTGQIIWALVDGAAQAHINVAVGALVFDLLA